MKTIVITFGRMNPPTAGHQKLIEKVASIAKKNSADFRIYTSQTQDKKKNPLIYKDKIKFLKKLFPKYVKNIEYDPSIRTFLEACSVSHDDGYTDLIFVVGSDRVVQFTKLLNEYNGDPRLYSFDSINVVSAGERDPDSEGVDGMSASKMRAFAVANDITKFKKGVPKGTSTKLTKELFVAVQKGMGISS